MNSPRKRGAETPDVLSDVVSGLCDFLSAADTLDEILVTFCLLALDPALSPLLSGLAEAMAPMAGRGNLPDPGQAIAK